MQQGTPISLTSGGGLMRPLLADYCGAMLIALTECLTTTLNSGLSCNDQNTVGSCQKNGDNASHHKTGPTHTAHTELLPDYTDPLLDFNQLRDATGALYCTPPPCGNEWGSQPLSTPLLMRWRLK